MNGITIRPIHPRGQQYGRELTQVAEIEAESFDKPWLSKHFHKACETDGASILLACWTPPADFLDFAGSEPIPTGEEIAGFVMFDRFDALWNQAEKDEHPVCQLIDVAVRKRHRRRGIAKLLIEAAEQAFAPIECLAQVVETNLDAQLFFRSIGYVATDIWRPGDDNSDPEATDDYYLMTRKAAKQ